MVRIVLLLFLFVVKRIGAEQDHCYDATLVQFAYYANSFLKKKPRALFTRARMI